MSNIRLSSESLMYYKQSMKNKATPSRSNPPVATPFVSFVHGEEDSDDSEDDSEESSNSFLMTPKLKKYINSGEKKSQATSFRLSANPLNLTKRLSSSTAPDSTPDRILKVALEQGDFNGFTEAESHPMKRGGKKHPEPLLAVDSEKSMTEIEKDEESTSDDEPTNSAPQSPLKKKKPGPKSRVANSKLSNKPTNTREPKSTKTRKNQKNVNPQLDTTEELGRESTEELIEPKEPTKRGRKTQVDKKVAAPKKTTRSTAAADVSLPIVSAQDKKRTKKEQILKNMDCILESVIAASVTEENDGPSKNSVVTREKTTSKLSKVLDEKKGKASSKETALETEAVLENKVVRGRGRPKFSVSKDHVSRISAPTASVTKSPTESRNLKLAKNGERSAKSPIKTKQNPKKVTGNLLDDKRGQVSSPEFAAVAGISRINQYEMDSDTSSTAYDDDYIPKSPPKSIKQLDRSPTKNTPKAATSPKSSPKKRLSLASLRSTIPVPSPRRPEPSVGQSPERNISVTEQTAPEQVPHSEKASGSKRTPLRAGSSTKSPFRAETSSVILNGSPSKSVATNPKEIQSTSPNSATRISSKRNERTPALKRKSSMGIVQPLSNKRLRFPLNESQRESINTDNLNDESDLIRAAANRSGTVPQLSSAIDPTTLPLPHYRERFNPFTAPLEEPVRCQLLSNKFLNNLRITLFQVQSKCFYSLKVHWPTEIVILTGSLEIGGEAQSTVFLSSTVRIAELSAGILCHLRNTGDEVAEFQIIERLF